MSFEQNNLFDYIANDVASGQKMKSLRWLLSAAVVLIPAIFIASMGFNPGLTWSGSWMPWAMLLSFVALVLLFGSSLGGAPRVRWITLLCAAVLFFSLIFPQFGDAFDPVVESGGDWLDSLHCFGFGLMMGAVTSCVLIFTVFRWGPVPNSGTRLTMSQVAGLAGVVGLFFYCPNSDLVHLFTGHGLQTAIVFAGAYLFSQFLFSRIIRKQLGKSAVQFENLRKFDNN